MINIIITMKKLSIWSSEQMNNILEREGAYKALCMGVRGRERLAGLPILLIAQFPQMFINNR